MVLVIVNKNCSCLVIVSNDLDENVKAAAMFIAVVDIGDNSVFSKQSNNCAFATK